jgi:HK97 family phage portal protein
MFGLFKRSTPQTNELLKTLTLGSNTPSGMLVNSSIAETLPAIYCAVSVIAESIATLPTHVFRKGASGKQRLNDHHVERLLNIAPNEYQSPYEFKIALMRAVLLRGNGYARITFDGAGKAAELHLLHPDAVLIDFDKGRLRYRITGTNGKQEVLLKEEVLHVKYHSDDGIVGRSPVSVCRDVIGLGLAQQSFQSNQFKNGVSASGVLETDSKLTDEQFYALQDMVDKKAGTNNAGRPLILEGGLKWNQIGLSNEDSQWLESRLFTISDIARMFKLSPIFLQDYSNSTYSNFSEASRAFLSQSLRPWLTNLQQAYSRSLISERNKADTFLEFETKDLLRATTEERFASYDIAIRNGLMSPNECRAAENLPPRPGGDEFSQSWNQNAQTTTNQTD